MPFDGALFFIAAMLPFLRPDLALLQAYTPHPEMEGGLSSSADRLDTNEYPEDWPLDLKQKLGWLYQQQIESNRYPDGSYGALKAAIAAYVTESTPGHLSIQADQISVGNGSDELIRSLLIATCLGGSGAVLVANPTFSMYAILAQTLGIPVVNIPRTDTFALDLQAAQAALSPSAPVTVRVVFMVHPNSPTGNALTPDEVQWLQQLPPEVLVVIDEAYFEFSQQTLVGEIAQRPNWVILRTFSKAFRLAAHRVGYAIAQPALIEALEKVRLPYNLPALSQAAAHLALTHRHTLLQEIPALLAEREGLYRAFAAFPTLRCWPSTANFLYLQLDTEAGTQALQRHLKQHGTSVRYTGGGLRITIGSPAENQRTLTHLQRYFS